MTDVPSANSIARVVRWAIILFFAYALWHSSFSTPKSPPAPHTAPSQQTATKEKDCGDNPLQNFPAFAMPLLPAALPALRIEDRAAGTGEPAQCGQTASLRYEYDTQDGKVIFKSTAAENIRIGDGELLRGAELGLIGMKPGERTITMAPPLAFTKNHTLQLPTSSDIKKQSITAKLSLLKLRPDVPSSPMKLRIIDTRFGNGPRAECGDSVTADITIRKLDGTKLFSTLDSKPVTFTLGKSEAPYGIEQATVGMAQGSGRTLIMPPALTKPLIPTPCIKTHYCEAPLIPAQFPEHEMVLVEMTRLPDVKEPAATPMPLPPIKNK